jgi:hypothetical protein
MPPALARRAAKLKRGFDSEKAFRMHNKTCFHKAGLGLYLFGESGAPDDGQRSNTPLPLGELQMKDTRSSLSRRHMLIASGGAVAVFGAAIAVPARASASPGPRGRSRTPGLLPGARSLATAGHDEWAAQVGSTFAIAGAQGLALTAVRPLHSSGRRPAGARGTAFVAQFDLLGAGPIAGDRIYTVSHPQHGPFQMFLTAAGDARNPGRMHAVFN